MLNLVNAMFACYPGYCRPQTTEESQEALPWCSWMPNWGEAMPEVMPEVTAPAKPEVTQNQLDARYVAAELSRFHRVSAEDWASAAHNTNISPTLFDFDFAISPNTVTKYSELDAEWGRRILLENTSRGLVSMYYQPSLQAFAYITSVQVTVPILNACAMKYVRIYFCRDLFNDSDYLPKNVVSSVHKLDLRLAAHEQTAVKRPSYITKMAIDPKILGKTKVKSRATDRVAVRQYNRFKQVNRNLSHAPFTQAIPFATQKIVQYSYQDFKDSLAQVNVHLDSDKVEPLPSNDPCQDDISIGGDSISSFDDYKLLLPKRAVDQKTIHQGSRSGTNDSNDNNNCDESGDTDNNNNNNCDESGDTDNNNNNNCDESGDTDNNNNNNCDESGDTDNNNNNNCDESGDDSDEYYSDTELTDAQDEYRGCSLLPGYKHRLDSFTAVYNPMFDTEQGV